MNRTTVTATSSFSDGTQTGQVMQFVVVPEPATLALAGIGAAMAAWKTLRRRAAG